MNLLNNSLLFRALCRLFRPVRTLLGFLPHPLDLFCQDLNSVIRQVVPRAKVLSDFRRIREGGEAEGLDDSITKVNPYLDFRWLHERIAGSAKTCL